MASLPAAESARLVQQLREFGVDGEVHELEGLLEEARLSLRLALNLFFDRGCQVARPPPGSGDEADEADEAFAGAAAASARLPCDQSRSRDRRRAQRQGAEAAAAPPRARREPHRAGRPVAPAGRPLAPRDQDSRPHRPGRSQASRPPAAPGGSTATLEKATFRYTDSYGISYEVDAREKTQLSLHTGEIREIWRRKPSCWVVKVPSHAMQRKSCMPLPKEVSHFLEAAGAPRPAQAPPSGGGADGAGTTAARDGASSAIEKLLEEEAGLPPSAMEREQVESTLEAAFREAARDRRSAPLAASLVRRLAARQGLRCTTADARRAGLLVGSTALLQAVLGSNASMQLVGVEVFDKHYASLKFNTEGRKDGVRCLLARGMTLGSHAPPSKLLRKLEKDSVPEWEDRYIDAMLRACPLLPDCTLLRVRAFLSHPEPPEPRALAGED